MTHASNSTSSCPRRAARRSMTSSMLCPHRARKLSRTIAQSRAGKMREGPHRRGKGGVLSTVRTQTRNQGIERCRPARTAKRERQPSMRWHAEGNGARWYASSGKHREEQQDEEYSDEVDYTRESQGGSRCLPVAHQEVRGPTSGVPIRAH